MRLDMPMLFGAVFLPKGTPALILGLTLHFMMGAIYFVIYAVLFNALHRERGSWAGRLFWVGAGRSGRPADGHDARDAPLHLLPAGRQRKWCRTPGLFASSFGLMVPVAILALHMVYGVTGGLIYSA